jgi:D-3-phosphoglycerate dehydrogenase
MTKVLVATVKPFAKAAVDQIKATFEKAGYDVRFFEKYEGQDALKEAVADAEALIIRSDKITEEILDAAPNLKIVVRAGAGYDNVDLAAATKHGVVVENTPGQNSNAVAELALGMMVFQARNHFNGKAGSELKGKKLGIQAYGHVGKNVARIAKGFGMEVYAFDPFVPKETMEADGVTVFDNLQEMYQTCDYISLHIPANPHTVKSVNYALLSQMKQGATLVNTARKEVIDEEGLLKMFREREDFKYVSDIAPDNRETIENEFGDRCFFTPKKMGAQTAEANINAGIAAANQIIAFFEKGDTTFKVN